MDILIPQAPFEALPVALLLLIGAGALWLLAFGAERLVDGASELALRLGIPKVVIGATIISLGTTAPECAVSVMAAWQGNAGLALGNAVGSVIFDTAVIFGGGCLLVALPADKFLLQRQGWVQFGSAALLAAFCYFQFFAHGEAAVVPRWTGGVFLVLLGLYLWISVVWSRQHTTALSEEIAAAVPGHPQKSAGRNLGALFLGLLAVLIGSRITIVCVTILAHRLRIPEVVISATLVAFGTSLPELIVGITAIRKKHPELLVGNVVGADILNILFVTGAAAVARPLPIVEPGAADPYVFLRLHLPVMLGVLIYFRVCIAASVGRGHFTRWMGIPLLVSYAAFVIFSVMTGQGVPH